MYQLKSTNTSQAIFKECLFSPLDKCEMTSHAEMYAYVTSVLLIFPFYDKLTFTLRYSFTDAVYITASGYALETSV